MTNAPAILIVGFSLVMTVISAMIVRSDPVRGPALLGILALLVATLCSAGLALFVHSQDPSPYSGPAYGIGFVILIFLFVGFVHLVLGALFVADAYVNRSDDRPQAWAMVGLMAMLDAGLIYAAFSLLPSGVVLYLIAPTHLLLGIALLALPHADQTQEPIAGDDDEVEMFKHRLQPSDGPRSTSAS
jgi:hypothetical protein